MTRYKSLRTQAGKYFAEQKALMLKSGIGAANSKKKPELERYGWLLPFVRARGVVSNNPRYARVASMCKIIC